MNMTLSTPIVGFVAYSGTGKTTLLLKIIPLLKAKGLRLGVVKHTHHTFDIDQPGKDSYRLRQAGADQTLVASRQRWALMVETGKTEEPCLAQVLEALNPKQLDLVLVEGFKHEVFPKIEVYRPSLGYQPLFKKDASIIAVVTDTALLPPPSLPVLSLNNPASIIHFIEHAILTRGYPDNVSSRLTPLTN